MLWKSLLVCVVAGSFCVCAHRPHTHAHTHPHTASVQCQDASSPCVVTPAGAIRGSWMRTRRERAFQAYRGIRYAEPPVGELRFQPPKPIIHYAEEVDASQEGPACPLLFKGDYFFDEDCLRVNVYTPGTNRSQLLPVIVYIHAGGFYSMSGRSDIAGPHYFLDRDVVLVTMNYRLASLGFLSTGDALAPGNNGLKDQVAALRWVQRNIAAFGGNPDLVTISGCSAGAMSVMLHMISPMSKGLFHRAISMSGSPTMKVPSRREMRDLAVKQAELVGCPTNTTQAIFDCLKALPWKVIGDSLGGFFEFGFDPVGVWLPVVEMDFGQERFLPIEPMDAIREGKMHPVPYIISQTRDEFFWIALYVLRNDTLRTRMNNEWERIAPISFMLPRDAPSTPAALRRLREVYLGSGPIVNDAKVANGLGKLYGDAVIGFSVHRLANLMCRHSPQPVYYYEFSYIGNHSHYEDPVTNKPTAVAHHDDLIYLFTLSYRFPTIPLDSPDNALVERMTGIFYNFAIHGDPAHPGLPELASLRWPAMTPQRRSYLRIGDSFSVHQNLFEDRFQLWEELYPIQY